jgi:hypothetical protein
MTEFSKARVSHAAGLVHAISEKAGTRNTGAEDEHAELYAWLQAAVDHNQEDALSAFMRESGPVGSASYSIAQSAVRAVGSICQIDGQACALFGFPLVLSSEKEFPLRAIECRQKIEMALEEAKGLRFKSVRLCQFPVRRVAVENMTAWQLGRLGRDLFRYADSKLLRATTVSADVDVLVWLGLYKLDDDDSSALFDVRGGTALLGWRDRTKRWLTEELSAYGVGRCDPTAPMRIHDAISTTRLYQARNDWLHAKTAIHADSVSASLSSARLHWTFENSKTGETVEGEVWLPDENETLGLDALKAFARKYALSARKVA